MYTQMFLCQIPVRIINLVMDIDHQNKNHAISTIHLVNKFNLSIIVEL